MVVYQQSKNMLLPSNHGVLIIKMVVYIVHYYFIPGFYL